MGAIITQEIVLLNLSESIQNCSYPQQERIWFLEDFQAV